MISIKQRQQSLPFVQMGFFMMGFAGTIIFNPFSYAAPVLAIFYGIFFLVLGKLFKQTSTKRRNFHSTLTGIGCGCLVLVFCYLLNFVLSLYFK